MSTKEGLKIHIECEKRPGLLRDIMELLESRGLNVEKASVAFDEHFVLDCVGSEVQTINPWKLHCWLTSTILCRHLQNKLKLLVK